MNILARYSNRYYSLPYPTFKVGTYGADRIVGTDAEGKYFDIVKIDGSYFFDSLEGPALSFTDINGHRLYVFIVRGVMFKIEEMPIDPTLKVLLTLKYSPRYDGSMFYVI